jgi:hypothetical protein
VDRREHSGRYRRAVSSTVDAIAEVVLDLGARLARDAGTALVDRGLS